MKTVDIIEMPHGDADAWRRLREGYLASTGDYIAYSYQEDDETDLFEKLIKRAEETDADIVIWEGSHSDPAGYVVEGLEKLPLSHKIFRRELFHSNGVGNTDESSGCADYVLASQLLMTAGKIEVLKEGTPELNDRITREGIEDLDGFMNRYNLKGRFGRSLARGKMRLKHRLLMTCDRKEISNLIGVYMDVEPSVMEKTEMPFMSRMALAMARVGDSLLYRVLRLF